MSVRSWSGPLVIGMMLLNLLTASSAMASSGSASSIGSQLKVKAETLKLSQPGEPTVWQAADLYIRIADPASVAANNYRGFDPDNPIVPIDVTGRYRIADDSGGQFELRKGCIYGLATDDTPQLWVVFCESASVTKLSVKTGGGDDSVRFEASDPAGSVPSSVTSTITTGKGNDSVFGGRGPDTIKTGPGDDIVTGGPGADTFMTSSGNDTVDASDDDFHDAKVKCGGGTDDQVFFDSFDGDPSVWKDCEHKTLQ